MTKETYDITAKCPPVLFVGRVFAIRRGRGLTCPGRRGYVRLLAVPLQSVLVRIVCVHVRARALCVCVCAFAYILRVCFRACVLVASCFTCEHVNCVRVRAQKCRCA
eukprot:6207236-Pleurochrysis_carterae.AAC.1